MPCFMFCVMLISLICVYALFCVLCADTVMFCRGAYFCCVYAMFCGGSLDGNSCFLVDIRRFVVSKPFSVRVAFHVPIFENQRRRQH